jgi:hypothetical protein
MAKPPPKTPAPNTAEAFKQELPDRPWGRFQYGFLYGTPMCWLAILVYGHSSALRAAMIAIAVGCGLGLIGAVGKRPLAWIINFIGGGV